MTTGKTIALIRWTFVGKVMSLLFNMLSQLIITFLPRSKCLLISWLQSSSAVILESKTIKSLTVSIVSPSICPEVMGLDAMEFAMVLFRSVQFIHSVVSNSLQPYELHHARPPYPSPTPRVHSNSCPAMKLKDTYSLEEKL